MIHLPEWLQKHLSTLTTGWGFGHHHSQFHQHVLRGRRNDHTAYDSLGSKGGGKLMDIVLHIELVQTFEIPIQSWIEKT